MSEKRINNNEFYQKCVKELESVQDSEVKTTLLSLCENATVKDRVRKQDKILGVYYDCCPECDAEVSWDARYCENCGKALNKHI